MQMILRASVGTAMMIIDVLRGARRTARVGAGLAKTLCARPDALLLKHIQVFRILLARIKLNVATP